MVQPFIILHTNDIHRRIEGLARIATLVAQIRIEHPNIPVLYFDIGDIEENSVRISNLTKGTAMHRLLSVSGCDVEVIGNGSILRYGYQVLPEYAKVARYPLLLANMYTPDGKSVPGVQPTAMFQVETFKLGLIGVTSDIEGAYDAFNVSMPPVLPLVQEHAAQLRESGANAVILLSHLGLNVDRGLAAHLQHNIPLIIGAHSHDLMPEGEWVNDVFITQAGEYAQYLGRLDLLWDGTQLKVQHANVLPITDAIQPSLRVLNEAGNIEVEVEQYLQEIVGELVKPLDYASDRECGAVNLMADMLRERMHADVAIITAGVAFTGPLPAGPLRRMTLWDVCTSPGNPGVVTMTGTQLLSVVRRGLDPDFAKDCPRPMRGQRRGFMHLSGARISKGQLVVNDQPIEPGHEYRVAGSDWELSSFGGYVNPIWDLRPHYDVPTILREALEEYLVAHSPIHVAMGRITSVPSEEETH